MFFSFRHRRSFLICVYHSVHRLTATLAFLLHLSPIYADNLQPLLEVLQARDVLLAKLSGGPEGCGEKGVMKRDVRELVREVADELCVAS